MVWPSAAILRTSAGCSEAGLPIRKNVARTHSWASAARTRGVVGCEDDLVIFQRQRLWKVFQADPRRGGRVDAKNARGAERPLARTVRCPGRHAPRHRGDEGGPQQVRE